MGIRLIFRKPLLYLFGASSATFPYANAYISIYLCGTVFVMISLGMNQFINSQGIWENRNAHGNAWRIYQYCADPILIFGLDMGVQGAALCNGDLPGLICSLGDEVSGQGRRRFFDSPKEQCIWSGSL